MYNGEDCYAARLFAVHEKEWIASHEYATCLREIWKPRLREVQGANRSSLDCLAKTRGTVRLHFCVVLNLAKKFCFRFL